MTTIPDSTPMKKNTTKLIARVPISMTAEEAATLAALAASDQRSKSSMARIIYLAGLEKYSRGIRVDIETRCLAP